MWLCIIWQRGSRKRMSHIFMALQCILNSRVTSVEVFCWRVAKMLRKETVGGRFGCILLFDHIWREVAGRFICIHSSPLEMIGAGDPPPITHLVKGDCATDCQNNLHHVLLFSIKGLFTYYVSRRRGGRGYGKCWPLLTKGGGGVSRKLTIADEGGKVECWPQRPKNLKLSG